VKKGGGRRETKKGGNISARAKRKTGRNTRNKRNTCEKFGRPDKRRREKRSDLKEPATQTKPGLEQRALKGVFPVNG